MPIALHPPTPPLQIPELDDSCFIFASWLVLGTNTLFQVEDLAGFRRSDSLCLKYIDALSPCKSL